MKSVLFRADAAPHIGVGDLVTLINLSRHIQIKYSDISCHFMVRDFPTARKLITDRKINFCHFLSQDATPHDESAIIKHYIEYHRIDCLIFEVTDRQVTDYDLSQLSIPIGAIDFFHHVSTDLKWILNWDVDATHLFGNDSTSSQQLFLGPEYVILPTEFDFNWVKQRQHTWPPENILITMGGNDERLLSLQLLKQLIGQLPYHVKFSIIIGPGYVGHKDIEVVKKQYGDQVIFKTNVKNMFAEYMRADYAISAGGVSVFELLACRTPCSLVACYQHQVKRCLFYDHKQWANYLGFHKDNISIQLPQKLPLICQQIEKLPIGNKLDQLIDTIFRNVNE
jgi:UDP-2,4-diacetamido-2,4,6-trideoxy-beta-L-altropyranose hydrolase